MYPRNQRDFLRSAHIIIVPNIKKDYSNYDEDLRKRVIFFEESRVRLMASFGA